MERRETGITLTLKDIARQAGVSLATVDRVLHSRAGVRPDTLRRVKETIERNAFRPHVAAAELARGRSRRFAFVMPSGPNLFMQQIQYHAERIFGFNQVMASEFSQLDVLPVLEGRDADEQSEQLLTRLLNNHADIAGLYNVGAGTVGVAKALIESGREKQVVFVGHDVTVVTRKLLLQGVIDAAISQNPGHEARAAVRVLLALARGEPILNEQENIRIDIVMRDNLP
jgi:ABC-type sugar transport system substrate-binding protein